MNSIRLSLLIALGAITVSSGAEASIVSVQCPCTVEQTNQTSALLKFGLSFDAITDDSGSLEVFLAHSDGLGFLEWTILSELEIDAVAYSENPINFELPVPLFAMNQVRERYLGLVLKANGVLVDTVLLDKQKVEIPSRLGVFFNSSDRFFFEEEPVFVFSEDSVRITVEVARSTKHKSTVESLEMEIRVANSEFNYFLKGSASEAIEFNSDGSTSIDYEIPLDRKIDSHIVDNPEHTGVWLSLGINGEKLLRYFIKPVAGNLEEKSYLSFTDVDAAEDSDADGFSDYLQYLLGENIELSKNGSAAVVEIGFTYGQRVLDHFGSSLEARLDHVVAVANKAFSDSGVNLQIVQSDLIFIGEDNSITANTESLVKLKERGAPFVGLDERFKRHPDIIVHLSTSRTVTYAAVGIAVIGGDRNNGIIDTVNAYKNGRNVAIAYLDSQDLVLAHELGHVFGLGHSRRELSSFPWSVGHGVEDSFATIMSYARDFNVDNALGYFSTPRLQCDSISNACGVNISDLGQGADSVKALNITGWQISSISNGYPPHINYSGSAAVSKTSVDISELKKSFRAFDSEDGEITEAIELDLTPLERSEFVESYDLSVGVSDSDGNQASLKLILHLVADYDGDGLADREDTDDDNDGLSDKDEIELGLNPLNVDSDADGVADGQDAFPKNAAESFDIDSDGIGNNADLDDDNDGFTDEQELADGTDPLSRFSCRSGCFSFDVDENLEAQPLTDGLLVIRHLFGFSGDS